MYERVIVKVSAGNRSVGELTGLFHTLQKADIVASGRCGV